ncbi:protein kinase domain-containing protein [Nocardioides sp. P5_C9_2]
MPDSIHAGEVLASRYRLDDLLTESEGGRFWRAHDSVLHRHVAVHLISRHDARAPGLLEAARTVAPHVDPRLLRVLDAEQLDDLCYVVNEWGQGTSLDVMLANDGPLAPRYAAWIVSEVADSLTLAHAAGLAHGRMVPENVLIDHHGQVRIIGFAVDAALHGLPPGRRSADLVDTAGLLYAALTGKWAGVSTSLLPDAPTDHGAVLRPRRVRAGIPRALDALCDQVLNEGRSGEAGISAAVIAEMLREYVGDASGLRETGHGATQDHPVQNWAPPQGEPTRAVPTVSPAVPTTTDAAPSPAPAVSSPATPVDHPTQAGMPVFDDERDDVGWVAARSDTPPPPPPFEERPAKPLFAPEPPEGQPARRPREGVRPSASGYWPWEATAGGSPSGSQTGQHTGSGSWPSYDTSTGTGDVVPGRGSIRFALLIGLCLLVAMAALAAYQLGRPDGEEATTQTPGSPVTTAAPTPFPDVTARDFDPQGTDGQVENSDRVPLVLDGNGATAWTTSSYAQQLGPAGLKTGVGLVIDLGRTRGVRQVDVATLGGPTSLSIYVTGQSPTGVADLTPVGTASGSGALTVDLDEAVSGRFVTVWLTALPQLDGSYRGTVSDVVVAG